MPDMLPANALHVLLRLADESDFLIFGETHGTQEVSRLVASLLSDLEPLGYRALALEVPADAREPLVMWARGQADTPPFFARPAPDGRGNVQVLALVREVVQCGWDVICFDQETDQPFEGWTERDADMARNLSEQRERFCPGSKAVAICGNLHSRLTPPSAPFAELWPSFAAALQERQGAAVVRSVALVFHEGAYYNGGEVRPFSGEPLAEAEMRNEPASGHSRVLHLPTATAATFLAAPS